MNNLHVILVVVLMSLSFGVNAGDDSEESFYVVFTTEFVRHNCNILKSKPLRHIAYYDTDKSMSSIAAFVEAETNEFESLARKSGFHAIVGFRENLNFTPASGMATFTGVTVKLGCDLGGFTFTGESLIN